MDETENIEMFMNMKNPKIGEADETLQKALRLKFGVGKGHFNIGTLFNLFIYKTFDKTVPH